MTAPESFVLEAMLADERRAHEATKEQMAEALKLVCIERDEALKELGIERVRGAQMENMLIDRASCCVRNERFAKLWKELAKDYRGELAACEVLIKELQRVTP